jgi:hypothetical protein
MLNDDEHLLVCLMEEAAEVQQDCAKILRFGVGDFNPDDPEKRSNVQRLYEEIIQLTTIVDMMKDNQYFFRAGVDKDVLSKLLIHERMARKRRRVLQYMDYARERGTLGNGIRKSNCLPPQGGPSDCPESR